jgi:acyl dehydratase
MVEERKETVYGTKIADEEKPVVRLSYDDIKVGDELPPFTRYMTMDMAVKHGRIYGDFYSGHVDKESARKQFGVAKCAMQGALVHGGFTPFMVRWLRSERPWICGGKADIKFVMAVNSGMTLRYCGKVIEKKVDGNKKYVVCETWAENERGEKVAVGQCTACLQ